MTLRILATVLLLLGTAFVYRDGAARTIIHGTANLTELDPSEESHWQLADEKPMYPRELAIAGISGCLVLGLEVSPKGKTRSPEILQYAPDSKVKRPWAKGIRRIQWTARKPGDAADTEQKRVRLDFCLGHSREEAEERCERLAEMPCE